MVSVSEYTQYLNQYWAYIPANSSCPYSTVHQKLASYTPANYKAATVSQQHTIEQEIFDIYRSINVVPITFYTIDSAKKEIEHLSSMPGKLSNKILRPSNAGQALCKYWFPSIEKAYTYHDKAISLSSRFYDDAKLLRAIRICLKHKKNVLPAELRSALSLVGGNMIQNFKPLCARSIIEYICPMINANVLDYSAGFGGRMLGCLTSPYHYNYTGIEPNTETYQSLTSFGELITSSQANNYSVYNVPSEEYDGERGFYDCAFSSPPYFNLEIYCGESTQCMNRYRTIDQWFEKYVEPTIRMLDHCLSGDGVYACNIADYKIEKEQFFIVDRWIALSRKMGWELTDTLTLPLKPRPGGGSGRSEGVYIFRRLQQVGK